MSWNGTVRCSYCYQTGHNARTCPDKTESYRSRAQQEVDNGEGREGYWHKQYAKRTGNWLNGDAAEEMKKKRAGGTRRCKYCGKTGHNTRTCPELKEAKVAWMENARKARQVVNRRFRELGLGVGALVKIERYGEPQLFMVDNINWQLINHEGLRTNGGEPIYLKRLTPGNSWDANRTVGYPNLEAHAEVEQGRWSEFELVGPVPVNGVGNEVLECEDVNLGEVFKERMSPNFHENRWS